MIQARRLLFGSLLVLLLAGAPLGAQEAPQSGAETADTAEDGTAPDGTEAGSAEESEPEAPAVEPEDLPFLAPLERLAVVLGSLHFLREICDAPDAGSWRTDMQRLIEAQGLPDPLRRRLVASFNSSYRSFASTYRSCTASAQVAMNRYRQEGFALARDITSRYGN